jgi:hypothetical protein
VNKELPEDANAPPSSELAQASAELHKHMASTSAAAPSAVEHNGDVSMNRNESSVAHSSAVRTSNDDDDDDDEDDDDTEAGAASGAAATGAAVGGDGDEMDEDDNVVVEGIEEGERKHSFARRREFSILCLSIV